MPLTALIDKLKLQKKLTHAEWVQLISGFTPEDRAYAAELARQTALERFGRNVYFRGIIELSNHCRNDCYYCGIRRSNTCVERYRLSQEDILACCALGYELGYRTFVLQGGEDGYFNDERMVKIVSAIRAGFPDCAITLSLGERSRQSYQALFDAGADRYLLRHESADCRHYSLLHPAELSLENRMRCLRDLKEIGYQTGCGIMVGSPHQTADNIATDMEFMAEFQPHMVGIGPFIPHKDTPFRDEPAGSVPLTLMLLSLTRLMLPDVLLPSTTALGSLQGDGRIQGVLAGCNVVMPNLSPADVRKNYQLYNNKAGMNSDAKSSLDELKNAMHSIGYTVTSARGDYMEWR